MRTSDADILMVPGLNGSGPDHWQSRWERNLRTARRVEQDDWDRPDKDLWVGSIIRALAASARPAVLVAHSLGVHAVAYATEKLRQGAVSGAFLVAPPEISTIPSAFRPRSMKPGLRMASGLALCRCGGSSSLRCCSPPQATHSAPSSARGSLRLLGAPVSSISGRPGTSTPHRAMDRGPMACFASALS